MNPTFVAIDIGASNGQLTKSTRDTKGSLILEEAYRFKNGFRNKDGHDHWKINCLIKEVLIGSEKLKQTGIGRPFAGIDTWAVDYCPIGEQGDRINDPIVYRDKRTNGAAEQFSEIYSPDKLYEQTGIQIQPFNTLFQLFAEEKENLAKTHKLLLISGYLGYVFTGNMVTEKTNASTVQLLNAGTKEWEIEFLEKIGVSKELFPPLIEPGTILGGLQKEQFLEYDLPDVTFITVAGHDTASTVLGTPGQGERWGCINSGTWSLLGIETKIANVSRNAFSGDYTNEWGAHNTVCFLKNIMGMWLIQEVARMQEYEYSYAELAEPAAKEKPLQQMMEINDPQFLNPPNMTEEIQQYRFETEQPVPVSSGTIARCVYDNLALCYTQELIKAEHLTGTKLEKLHIVGGGSNNRLLNQLTAGYAGIIVETGPSKATAIGNVAMQTLSIGQSSNIEQTRNVIKQSFPCETFYPDENKQNTMEWHVSEVKGIIV